MKRADRRIDELLSRGTLGGPAYDEILGRVLEQSAPATRRRWRSWAVWPTVALIPAVAAFLFVCFPRTPAPTPKGALGESASVALACGSSGRSVCRLGDTLMFSVNTAVSSGYFGAYAERLDDPAAERIWYFPTAVAAAPRVAPGEGTVVLPDGVSLGPEHRPGEYRVTVWLSERPLSRAEIGARPNLPLGAATLDMKVLP